MNFNFALEKICIKFYLGGSLAVCYFMFLIYLIARLVIMCGISGVLVLELVCHVVLRIFILNISILVAVS